MQSKAFLLTGALALAFLAGCSSPPPSGELVAMTVPLAIEGSLNITYVAESHPVQQDGAENVCVNDGPSQTDGLKCTDPSTTITGHIMSLPEPDGGNWGFYGVGTGGNRELLPLAASTGGMYEISYEVADDLSLLYQTYELRMGDFLYATAPADAGSPAFALAAITGVTATGTFDGKTLDVEISGFPAGNGTKYTGHLYMMGEDGNVTSAVNFPVKAGANQYVDEERNIGDYAEFHIHVGKSKINLFKASLD